MLEQSVTGKGQGKLVWVSMDPRSEASGAREDVISAKRNPRGDGTDMVLWR